jgi:hypothetical protein
VIGVLGSGSVAVEIVWLALPMAVYGMASGLGALKTLVKAVQGRVAVRTGLAVEPVLFLEGQALVPLSWALGWVRMDAPLVFGVMVAKFLVALFNRPGQMRPRLATKGPDPSVVA